MKKILILHGPNLNLLGTREVSIYGKATLEDIDKALMASASNLGVELKIVQSNHEGELVELIGKAKEEFDGILINPAAYTHTSVALRDALLASGMKAVEVHLSNIYQRESFRHESITAPACVGQISGFGLKSYVLGLDALVDQLEQDSK